MGEADYVPIEVVDEVHIEHGRLALRLEVYTNPAVIQEAVASCYQYAVERASGQEGQVAKYLSQCLARYIVATYYNVVGVDVNTYRKVLEN